MVVADSVPSAHDRLHNRVRSIPRLPDNKSKTQLCHTSNKEPVAETEVISLDAWEKGQQSQEAGLSVPTAHQCPADLHVLLTCRMGKAESTGTLFGYSQHSAALALSMPKGSPGIKKPLKFSLISMEDAMMFTILSLETIPFLVLNYEIFSMYVFYYIGFGLKRLWFVDLVRH